MTSKPLRVLARRLWSAVGGPRRRFLCTGPDHQPGAQVHREDEEHLPVQGYGCEVEGQSAKGAGGAELKSQLTRRGITWEAWDVRRGLFGSPPKKMLRSMTTKKSFTRHMCPM